jgi:hypothetical protein
MSYLPWVTTRTLGWGPSVIHFPRGKYQQHWDQIHFNDGGARFSADLIEDLENMCIVSVVPPHGPTSYANRVECQHVQYSRNLGKRWASCPSAFHPIAVSNSGIITKELNLIRSPSLSFFSPSLVYTLLIISLSSSKPSTHRSMCMTWFQTHDHIYCRYQEVQSGLLP